MQKGGLVASILSERQKILLQTTFCIVLSAKASPEMWARQATRPYGWHK